MRTPTTSQVPDLGSTTVIPVPPQSGPPMTTLYPSELGVSLPDVINTAFRVCGWEIRHEMSVTTGGRETGLRMHEYFARQITHALRPGGGEAATVRRAVEAVTVPEQEATQGPTTHAPEGPAVGVAEPSTVESAARPDDRPDDTPTTSDDTPVPTGSSRRAPRRTKE